MNALRRRLGLGAWLALAFSVLSILLTGVLTLVIERRATSQLQSDIGLDLAELANQTTTRLDRAIYERYREIQLLASRVGARQDWNGLTDELTAMQGSYRFYAWIGVADPAGQVRAASRGMLLGQNVEQRPWFQRGQQGGHLGDVHEAVLLAKLLGQPGAEPPRFFDVAFPLQGPGGAAGVLGAHVHWDWADDVRAAVFRPVGRSREVTPLILAADGTVLLGPPALRGQRLQLDSARRAQTGETGYAVETWPDGGRYLVGFSRSKGWESSPGLGWSVLVRQELAEAYGPIREMRGDVVSWGAGLGLLFTLIGLLLARVITRPLDTLTASARSLAAGQTELPLPSRAYREVESLGLSLRTLVSQLQSNQLALQTLNAELETRVAERTSELQQAFERVRSNEQRIQTIIESAQDPFIGMDLQGRITDWNTQAEVMFGWGREEVIGRPVDATLVPERYAGRLEAALQAFRATGVSPVGQRPIERVLRARDGREIPVEIRVGFVATGDQRFFMAFVHDISARREVERLKDEFVSTVSHELRTPLTAIYGSLDMLVSGLAGDLPDDVRHLLGISHESTERLIRLINDMLDIEKMASGKAEYRLRPVSVRKLLTQAQRDVDAYAARLGVSLQLVGEEDATVQADADRIVQVCVNLLSNAAKFSPPGAVVETGIRRLDGVVRVWVADRGPGIPEAFRARVFQRFAQADASDRRAKGGTGLGLSICHSIVEAHGGRIGFTSEPHVRTEFWFELRVEG